VSFDGGTAGTTSREAQGDRDDEGVVGVAEDRDEVRDEVDRRQ